MTGDLRWSRPVAVSCEKSNETSTTSSTTDENVKRTYHALKFSPDCFQVNPFTKKFTGSEDCLYLNIWTPTLDESVSEYLK